MKKDLTKIIFLLLILSGLCGGIYYAYKKDYFSSKNTLKKKKEDNNQDIKDNNTSEKIDNNKQNEENKEATNSTEKEDNTPSETKQKEEKKKEEKKIVEDTTNKEVKKEEVTRTKYYKEIKCSYRTVLEGDQIEYIYTGRFPAYIEIDFNPATNMEESIIEIYYNLTDYTSLSKEEREIVNKVLEGIKIEYEGYNGDYELLGNVAKYKFTGNTSSFINNMEGYNLKEVTYDSYLNFFERNGINCNQS